MSANSRYVPTARGCGFTYHVGTAQQEDALGIHYAVALPVLAQCQIIWYELTAIVRNVDTWMPSLQHVNARVSIWWAIQDCGACEARV